MWKLFWKNMWAIWRAIFIVSFWVGLVVGGGWMCCHYGFWGVVACVVAGTIVISFCSARTDYRNKQKRNRYDDKMEIENAYNDLRARIWTWNNVKNPVPPVGIKVDIAEFRILVEQFQERWGKDDFVNEYVRRFIELLNTYNIPVNDD